MPQVVVDTSVWVTAFRVSASREKREVDRLLARGEIALVGAVLAELLQGARSQRELQEMELRLVALPYLPETRETWAQVGRLSYELRRQGRALALVDLLIAALALEHGCSVYTLDEHLQSIPGVALHRPGEG